MPPSQPQSPAADGVLAQARAAARFHVPADLTVYAALVGCQPQIDPALGDPMAVATRAVRENPWSAVVLGAYVRQVVRTNGPKLNRPEVTAWVRRQSAVARRRLAETQVRMAGVALTMSRGRAGDEE